MSALFIKSLLVLGVSATLLASCNSNEELTGTSILRIRLTDSPGDYEAVYIDIQEIRVNATNDESSGWVTLENINAGVYDLMKLTNGVDTLLGENEIPSGKISQIRLILGDQNSVIDGTDSIGLKTPSAQQSGLKLQVHAELEAELAYDILLDFDAASSVVKAGNSGNYILKPVVRTVIEQFTGSIKGSVEPATTTSAVYAISGEDSTGTFTDIEGAFLIKGLSPETYSLYVDPGEASGFLDTLISNITVQTGIVTNVDKIVLEPTQP